MLTQPPIALWSGRTMRTPFPEAGGRNGNAGGNPRSAAVAQEASMKEQEA